jgi:hypothetical protein
MRHQTSAPAGSLRKQRNATPVTESGDHSAVAPPVPIPNTEVKRCSPDGSACIACARVGRRQNLCPASWKQGAGLFRAIPLPLMRRRRNLAVFFADQAVPQRALTSLSALGALASPLAWQTAETAQRGSPSPWLRQACPPPRRCRRRSEPGCRS